MKWWTVQEVVSLTGFSESKIRRDLKANLLRAKKIGHSIRIQNPALVSYLGFDPTKKKRKSTKETEKDKRPLPPLLRLIRRICLERGLPSYFTVE